MSGIGYNLNQSFKQIWRNKGMSLASTFAITAMLLILGLFFVITVNVNVFSETLKSDYDQVEIFLKDEATTEQIEDFMKQMDRVEGVKKISYRDKAQAMEIMKSRWGENGYLLDTLESNPLPSSVIIETNGISGAEAVNKAAKGQPVVEDVKYYKETVDKLTKATTFMKWGAIVIMVFLVFVSIIVVSNTIKLTVLARSKEISIMRYIGASNWFIRGPFLLEGIIIGLISSVIAWAVTYALYSKFIANMGLKFIAIISSPLVPASYLAVNLIIIFMAIGITVGACGSIISMKRFLKV